MAKIAKTCRPQENHGYHEEHRLPQMRQTDTHRETGERPRARHSPAESLSPARLANSHRNSNPDSMEMKLSAVKNQARRA